MIIIEGSIIIGIVTGVYGIKVLSKKFGYKMEKSKLKKLLVMGFDSMNSDLIRRTINSLSEFDGKHSTKKLDKYLLDIVTLFRDDENKTTLNEKNVLNLVKEFTMENLLEDEAEARALKVEETLERVREAEQKREEMLMRKDLIRERQLAKSNKRRKIRVPSQMG